MFSAFNTFGKLGALASSVARAWSPLDLWPDGIDSPGMWIDPSLLSASFNDYTGTTPVATPGSVADSANPVGLALDIRAGATAVTDPGLHMLQSTSAARPLLSARVNLLTKTEDFADAVWGTYNPVTITPNNAIAPDGTLTAATILLGSVESQIFQNVVPSYPASNQQVYMRAPLGNVSVWFTSFDGGTGGVGETATTASLTAAWTKFEMAVPAFSGTDKRFIRIVASSADTTIEVWHPQANLGSTALPYQRVGEASDYDTTGFPAYLKFDGVDDALASATFTAGTLTSSMDCLIAVRRDSAAQVVIFYQTAGGSAYVIASPGSSSGAFQNAGSPTVWVDGTQLSGGTSVTAETLHTALTPGAWHILECRGLNLSAWTDFSLGNWLNTYQLNGGLGDIQLFASGQDANRDKARAQMAAYFGVTLP